ncbi:MAG: hypothetical protein H6818_17515 [Phycisphaerales bacterium]|nr:hypothetical protein [Phycisphaerales bacterium]MCB9864572.1 hypothetical protein [Phycisphaerales bacterium]
MDIKKLGGILFTACVIGVVVYAKMGQSQEEKAAVEADAMSMIAQVDGYDANKAWYDSRAKVVVGQAYTASSEFKKTGRRSSNVFDEALFLPHFFEKLIAAAQNEGKQDIVKSLIAFRDANDIPRPGDIVKD